MSVKLNDWFPWTKSPLICNGPMLNVAVPKLATAVSKAGGLGFLACLVDVSPSSKEPAKLAAELAECRSILGDSSTPLAIGVSFITGHESITHFSETILPLLEKDVPAAVWLFAPDGQVKPHSAIIEALGKLQPRPRVFVQVGNVTAAKETVADGADVVVAQGIDAGGHQFRRGMGVVSFVPEARDVLGDKVVLLAAGGIADERGVAAAVVLGADGVVMGTRFTVAEESIYPDFRKQIVLDTVDGGSSTLKSPFNDQLSNLTLWGPLYDGRAIMSSIHERFLAGETLQELQQSLAGDYTPEEAEKLVKTWAGTGVGLVKDVKPAGDIVKQVREGAIERLDRVAHQVASRR